jgi:3-isopropylmalate/(R)-2-methylmalate dehydratase small subunit
MVPGKSAALPRQRGGPLGLAQPSKCMKPRFGRRIVSDCGRLKSRAKLIPMEPFRSHSGKIAVLNQDNLDTDRIIPARFLSMVSRGGYGELLFSDVRGEGFPLDDPSAKGATVLVAGSNFGCGSSREHAVWALQQAGFKAVIARAPEPGAGFSDIFRQNSANCGLLVIELPDEQHRALVEAGAGAEVLIDLESQLIHLGGSRFHFDIGEGVKRALTEGLDLIGTTLVHEPAIAEYEKNSGPFVPRL